MRMFVPILAAALALAACGETSGPACVTAPAASIRLPAVPGGPGAGYFSLRTPDVLLSVSSPRIQRIEMHETRSSGQMTSMRPIARATADECDEISFGPGGRHLMLFGIDPAVRPGNDIPLVFHFEQGRQRTMAATVAAAGGEHR
jgi:periplasmic copper chaperone A